MSRWLLLLLLIVVLLLALLPPASLSLRGLVLGPDGPLVGASVRLQATPLRTQSDRHGLFSLPRLPASPRVTASLPGFLITGTRAERPFLPLRLTPLPTEDHPDYAWVNPTPHPGDASRCGNCHRAIHDEWAAGGHARAALNPRFRNLYDGTDWHGRPGVGWSLLDEHPNGAGVCASCHAPALPDGLTNDPHLPDDDSARFDLRRIRGVAALGVHCDYCHKVAGQADGEIGLTHGRFLHRLLRPREGQLFFGPLDDVDRGEDAFSPYFRDSRYCAACHEGVLFGIRVYSTYSEWLDSPARRAGLHCQHCHMKPTGHLTNFAPGRGGLERDPSTLANHHFWDGSQLAMLRRSLHLDLTHHDRRLTVRLVAHDVGHRVPTGFIDRHLLLIVEAHDSLGQLIPLESGPSLSALAGPAWSGLPGLLFGRITRDLDGHSPVPFWRALPDPEDTRLRPGQPSLSSFTFQRPWHRLRVRLVHRRFWAAESARKHWPTDDLLIFDRHLSAPPARPTPP